MSSSSSSRLKGGRFIGPKKQRDILFLSHGLRSVFPYGKNAPFWEAMRFSRKYIPRRIPSSSSAMSSTPDSPAFSL